MTQENEIIDAQGAMDRAGIMVGREFAYLRMTILNRNDEITGLKNKIKVISDAAENAKESRSRAYVIADTSVFIMYAAIVVAFVAIGYAVWIG